MVSTAGERSIRARIGAHALHAQYDSREITSAARAAFLGTFEHLVDPTGVLSVEERARRAAHLRKAHFTRLALRSVQVRRTRKNGGG